MFILGQLFNESSIARAAIVELPDCWSFEEQLQGRDSRNNDCAVQLTAINGDVSRVICSTEDADIILEKLNAQIAKGVG